MSDEKVRVQELQEFVSQYFPRDAVQVLEDVRAAQRQITEITDSDTETLLASLGARAH